LPGTKVTVLEAMDQVGGRTFSQNINGANFDLGGTWIGKTQKYAQKLA
jgi:putrescine oxidase